MKRLIPIVASCWVAACAPVFNDFQSADLVGKGRVEVTPSFSSITAVDDGESDHLQYNVGLTAATGLTEAMDLRAGLATVLLDLEGANPMFVFGVGPKIRLGAERAAVYLPVGLAFGADVDHPENTIAWHPTFLVTGDIGGFAELTPSIKALIPLNNGDVDRTVAFNVGFGLGRDRSRFAVRPEVGLLFDPGDKGVFWSAGVGVSFGRGL